MKFDASRHESLRMQMRRKKSSKKQMKKKKSAKPFPVRKYVEVAAIEGTEYAIQYTLTPETIYEISRNRIKYAKEPKIETHPNKTQDLRDEFSAYCGVKKTIKNWLFYV